MFKNPTYFFSSILLLTLFPLCLTGQLPHEISRTSMPKDIYFQSITRGDGLPSNEVRCVTADFRGYIWIGTDNGLVRYDGTDMVLFQYVPGDTASLAGSTITAIMESTDTLLWIGTKSGLSVYDPVSARFSTYRHKENGRGFPCDWILSFWDDGKGTIWIGTNQGLIKTDRYRKTFQQIRLRRNEIPFDRENLFRWVNTICPDPSDDRFLFLATRGGILRFDTQNLVISEDAESQVDHLYRSSALYIDDDMVLWTGGWDTGLKAYDLNTKKWKIYNPDKGPKLNVLSIVARSESELWVG
jgi:ligand-binding sensor domain-containing protein